jgi:hypothetical protein
MHPATRNYWETLALSFAGGCLAGLLACYAGIPFLLGPSAVVVCLMYGPLVFFLDWVYFLPAMALMYGAYMAFLTHARRPTSGPARLLLVLAVQGASSVFCFL